MATAGRTLRVALVANTTNFRKGMMSAVRDAKGFQGKMSAVGASLSGMLGPAMIAAAAAAGALAVKMGIDGVKAAIAQEQQLARLTTALNNVGQSFAMTGVEDFIDKMQLATGVADDQLRESMIRLVTATQDAAKAQDLLSLALDISAGTGKDLQSVTMALAKAANGQTTALRRLGVPIDAAILKSGDLNAISAELSQTFQGQAAAAADTFAGRMSIVQRQAEDLQKAFGVGLLSSLEDTSGGMTDLAERMHDLKDEFQNVGESVGDGLGLVMDLANGYIAAKDAVNDFMGSLGDFGRDIENSIPIVSQISKIRAWAAILTGNDQALAEAYGVVADSAQDAATGGIKAFGVSVGEVTDEVEDLNEELGYLEGYLNNTKAILDYEASWDDLRKSLKENGKQFDYNTEAGRSNNKALMEYAESTAAVAATQETLFGKVAYVQDSLGNLSRIFEKTKMSPATQAAMLKPFQALIDDLDDAEYDVTTLQQQIDRLKGKNIPITVTTTYYGTPPPGGYTGGSAYGGYVAGHGGSRADDIPAWLSAGEFVIQAPAVDKFGRGFFAALNQGVNPLAGMTPTVAGGGGSGVTINGGITVQSTAGERAETSLPRALRRMAFLAGMNG